MDDKLATSNWAGFAKKWLGEKKLGRTTELNGQKITLTGEQVDCIDNLKFDDLLVQGAAGTGKSNVLVERAKVLAKAYPDTKVAIITYVNTLVGKLRIDVGNQYPNIVVETLDTILNNILFELTGKRIAYVNDSQKSGLIFRIKNIQKKQIKEIGNPSKVNRLLTPEYAEFLYDEFVYMKSRLFKSLDTYSSPNARKGRGKIKLTSEEKELIFNMYIAFYDIEEKNQARDTLISELAFEYLIDHKSEIEDKWRFEHVLIDEGQDFSLNKLTLAKILSKKSFTIVADMAQDIYKSGFTFSEANIHIKRGQSKELTASFRNTKQILALAKCFSGYYSSYRIEDDEFVNATMPQNDGEKPCLYRYNSVNDETMGICDLIRNIKKNHPKATLAIIYNKTNSICNTKIQGLLEKLKGEGLDYITISRNAKNDSSVLLGPSIKISSCHNAKGLEFDYVILPFLEDNAFPASKDIEDRDNFEKQVNLFYVGMTRAKKVLIMTTVSGYEIEFLDKLDKDLYENKQAQIDTPSRYQLELVGDGVDTSEESFNSVWKNATVFVDRDNNYQEYINCECILEHIEDYDRLLNPKRDFDFKVTGRCDSPQSGQADMVWPTLKIMLFTTDNNHHKGIAEETGWKLYDLGDSNFSWKEFLDSINKR